MRFMLPAVAMLLAATVSAAPTDNKEGPARGACRDEIKTICAGVQPGEGRLKQCMEANRDKFSPACKERAAHARDRAETAAKACQSDAQKLCPGVEHGGGKLHQCLQKNEGQLTETCRAAMKHKPRHPRPAKDPA